MTAWIERLRAAATNPAAPYVGAVVVRAGSRAVWGLALPAVLTVAAYGRYQLLATVAVMAAQLALLGTPQTIVRHAGRRIPMGAILFHALGIGLVIIVVTPLFLPTTRSTTSVAVLGGVVLATILVTTYGARAKARFAFGTSWNAELAGAAVLLVATSIVVVIAGRGLVTPALALGFEAFALASSAVVFVVALRRRSHTEPSDAPPVAVPAFLGDVYSVGWLVLLDVVLFRRLEVYFLERSPDGLAGVAVLGLALQIAAVAMLVPTALLEAWQPKLALLRRSGGQGAFEDEVRRRARQFAPLMAATLVASIVITVAAVALVFRQYQTWLWYIVAFVGIRVACAGAGLYSTALYAVGAQRALYAPAIVAATVAIGANAFLTRPMGLAGAVAAYFITQVVVAGLTILAFRRSSNPRPTAGSATSGNQPEPVPTDVAMSS